MTLLFVTLIISLVGNLLLGARLQRARSENVNLRMVMADEKEWRRRAVAQRNDAWVAESASDEDVYRIIVEIWGDDPPDRTADDVIKVIRQFRARL